jgi:hypothetical protein
MCHGSQTPTDHCESEAETRAQTIHDSPHRNQAGSVGCLKCKYQIAIVDLAPPKFMLQSSFEHSQDLAIHVVLCYAEQQERADDPAKMSDLQDCFLWLMGHWRMRLA